MRAYKAYRKGGFTKYQDGGQGPDLFGIDAVLEAREKAKNDPNYDPFGLKFLNDELVPAAKERLSNQMREASDSFEEKREAVLNYLVDLFNTEPEKKMMKTVTARKYENGGRPGRGEMLKQEGDTMVRYAMPSDEQLERSGGFFEPIPLDERDFKEEVQLPEELVGLERVAMRTKDPEAVAEYEAALAKFKDSPEYKEQLEAVRARRERAAGQVAEAKAGYEGRKAEYDKMREAMRVIMNSRLMD